MNKVAFLGFGEVNTPVDVIVRKRCAAEATLKEEGLALEKTFIVKICCGL